LAKPIANALAGLREAEVPSQVVLMLHAMLGPALSIVKEDRHTYEANIVELVGELLAATETRMSNNVFIAEAALKQLEELKISKQAALSNAEAVVESKKAVEQEKKRVLADHAREFKGCKAARAKAEAARETQANSLQETTMKREELAAAQASCAKPLIEGKAGDETAAKALGDKLIEVLKRFDVDTSIISALPSVFAKQPASRGPFDTMVLAQVEIAMSQRIAALDDTLCKGEAGKAIAVLAEQDAEQALEASRTRQLASAEAFKAASADRQAAEAKRDEALCDLVSIGPDSRRTTKERTVAEKRLHNFRCGPLDSFLRLRDRTATLLESEELVHAGEEATADADAASPASDLNRGI